MKSNPSCQANCIKDTIEAGLCDCFNDGTHPECGEIDDDLPFVDASTMVVAIFVVALLLAISCVLGYAIYKILFQ
jgi:hypothetical protein